MRRILIATGAFVAVIAIGTVRHWLTLRRLARSRAGQGFPEFSTSLAQSGVPEDVQRRVFGYLQENYGAPIAVRGEDPFDLYLGDVDDPEDAIHELSVACGKERPLLNVWKGQPIVTVGDLARLIAHLPTPEEVRIEGSRRLWTDQ